MKTVLSLLLCAFLFINCGEKFNAEAKRKDDESRVHDSISAYLKRYINDPESYEPVSFANFKIITDDKLKKQQTLEWRKADSAAVMDSVLGQMEKSKMDHEQSILFHKIVDTTATPISEYMIDHTFRSKNEYGAKMLSTMVFVFSRDFSIIQSAPKQ